MVTVAPASTCARRWSPAILHLSNDGKVAVEFRDKELESRSAVRVLSIERSSATTAWATAGGSDDLEGLVAALRPGLDGEQPEP